MIKYIVKFTSSLRTTIAMSVISVITMSQQAQAAVVSGQGTWETTLQGRDLDGNASTFEAYYDTTLNVTWLADANYVQTTGFDSDGRMPWYDATLWASSLNINGYKGWRLPDVAPANGVSYGSADFGYITPSTTNELAHLYYVTLGNTVKTSFTVELASLNTGPFTNLPGGAYWLNEQTNYYPSVAIRFFFSNGYQEQWIANGEANGSSRIWPVFTGDIAVVPEPTTHAMMGFGLMALIFAGRRKQQRYQSSLG